jgi:hypothetical protein
VRLICPFERGGISLLSRQKSNCRPTSRLRRNAPECTFFERFFCPLNFFGAVFLSLFNWHERRKRRN